MQAIMPPAAAFCAALALSVPAVCAAEDAPAPAPLPTKEALAAELTDTLNAALEYNYLFFALQERTDAATDRQLIGKHREVEDKIRALAENLRRADCRAEDLSGFDGIMSNYRHTNLLLLGYYNTNPRHDGQDAPVQKEKKSDSRRQNDMSIFCFTYNDPELLHRDTQRRLSELNSLMTDLLTMLRRELERAVDSESAAQTNTRITPISYRYEELCQETALYVEDDPEGAAAVLQEMEQAYAARCRGIKQQAERLVQADCYGNEELAATVQMLLHISNQDR